MRMKTKSAGERLRGSLSAAAAADMETTGADSRRDAGCGATTTGGGADGFDGDDGSNGVARTGAGAGASVSTVGSASPGLPLALAWARRSLDETAYRCQHHRHRRRHRHGTPPPRAARRVFARTG